MLIVPHIHPQGTLTRRDLIALEQRFCAALATILPFKAHSLYFPQEIETVTPLWISAESKLLLPLIYNDSLLGVFVARGVTKRVAQKLLPILPSVVSLCLENLRLYKAQCTDALTGFATCEHLMASMAHESDSARASLSKQGEAEALVGLRKKSTLSSKVKSGRKAVMVDEGMQTTDVPLHRACMGLVVLRLEGLQALAEEQGYAVANACMADIATALRAIVPQEALLARTDEYEVAILLSTAASRLCHKVAEEAVQHIRLMPFYLTEASMQKSYRKAQRPHRHIALSAGYAVYPRDMEGALFERSMHEQARVLLEKARHAAELAMVDSMGTVGNVGASHAQSRVMGFASILAEGGMITAIHPLSRLEINLGRNVHAREGQHFSVWSARYGTGGARISTEEQQTYFKGEIVLLDVREKHSVAEIVYLGDPTWSMESGDTLALLPNEYRASLSPILSEEGQSSCTQCDGVEQGACESREQEGGPMAGRASLDSVTGLYRHGDFLAQWSAMRDDCEHFCLAIMRLSGAERWAEGLATHDEQILMEAVRLCREEFGGQWIGGRYGLNSLIFYHAETNAQEAQAFYTSLCTKLEEHLHIQAAVGIGVHPFLDFRRADALDNALKSLEYGLLLPLPHIGIVDSVALTISADKRFSLGDTFEAIAEYKQALLADDENTMAWNSLGVCMASLGKYGDARRYFEEVIKHEPHDAMAHYNLGTVCQSLGEIDVARKHYLQCLKNAPNYVYAFIRLGQLAEAEEHYELAQKYYAKATKPSETAAEARGLVHRLVARLAIRQGRPDKAREALHEALLANAQDAGALQLLARLYLDGGEDPSMAEALSRQSVALRPNGKAAWRVLACALEAQGRSAEAREALLRAGDL